jgi:hypothetical protein
MVTSVSNLNSSVDTRESGRGHSAIAGTVAVKPCLNLTRKTSGRGPESWINFQVDGMMTLLLNEYSGMLFGYEICSFNSHGIQLLSVTVVDEHFQVVN